MLSRRVLMSAANLSCSHRRTASKRRSALAGRRSVLPLRALMLGALMLGVLTLGPAAPAMARTAQAVATDTAQQTYTYAFQDADISAVAAEILGHALGINYTVDPGVSGKMSFRIDQRLTRIQLLEAFEAALATSNVALVHQGDSLILEPPEKAKLSAGLRTADTGVHQAGYQVLAVPLSYASPSEVSKLLESIAPSGTVVYANDKTGLLILGGSAHELQSVLDTIRVFDRGELEDAKIRWFALNRASAASVATDLEKLAEASGATNLHIVPLKRLNGLVVFSRNPEQLDFVAKWIDRLDQASQDNASNLYVYHPLNVSADALRVTLSKLLGGGDASDSSAAIGPAAAAASEPPGPAGPPSASAPPESAGVLPTAHSTSREDEVRFSVDKDSNTLLIMAPLARWIGLQSVLAEIDRPPRQILIEATILEVTLTKDFHFGVDWSVLGSNKRLNLTEVGSNSSGFIGASYPGFSATFLSGTVQAAITTLGGHSDVEVVSAPKIIALDNHTAKLEVGDQVPIITQSSQSTITSAAPLINNIDYKNTGVIMTVTPRISGANKIVMDISQEVSSVATTSTSAIDSPTIQERKLESTLVMQDGGLVALGGLISTNRNKTIAGIPLIQDAPLIGSLFRNDTRSQARTELIVLLTGKILPDPAIAAPTMANLEADMKEITARGLITARP